MNDKPHFSLIRYRIEKARTSLDDARYLHQGNRSTHSIINRAYYAMFYAALAIIESIGASPSRHSGVIRLFDKECVQKGIFSQELSRNFHKAFELRQASDYKLSEDITLEQSAEMLDKAAAFVQAITDYLMPMEHDSDRKTSP